MESILKSWAYPLLLLASLGLPALPASASLDDGVLMLTFNHTFGKASSKLTIGYQQLESVDLNAYSGFNLSADFTLERKDLHLESFRFGLLNSDWHYESDIGLKFIPLENQWRLNSRISDDLYSLNVDLAPSGLLDGNPEEMIVNISKIQIAKDLLRIIEKKKVQKKPALPDGYWVNKKAPTQVTPGTRMVNNQKKPSSSGGTYPSTTHYDQFGRQIGQTHRTNHGRPADHPNPHHHRRNPTTGKKLKTANGNRVWPGLFGN